MWESTAALEARSVNDVGAGAADLDDDDGLELPTVDAWLDARNGEARERPCVPGAGFVGYDGVERPFVIRGEPALLEQERDRTAPWPLRAHSLSTGELLWERMMPPAIRVWPADFDDDGSVDVLVPFGQREDRPWLEEAVAYVDGATGTMTLLTAGEWSDYATTFDLYDFDDDGAPEVTLQNPITVDEANTCFFPRPGSPPIACRTVGRLVGRGARR